MPADALQRLRAKYPQYNDIPDQELARRVISRHPEYQDILGDIAAGPARPAVAPTVAPSSQQPLGLGERAYRAAETILGKGTLSPDVLGDVLALTPIGAGVGLAGRAILRGLRGAGIVGRAAPAVESAVARQLPLLELPRVAEPLAAKAGRLATEVLNAPRAIMSSFDVSAPFRQGAFVAAAHPRRFAQSFVQMFRYLGSEGALEGLQQEIAQRPTFQLMQRAKLALTGLQELGKTTGAEEAFIGARLAERIPGVGRVIKASDRAYTGFLTKLRADVFDDLLKNTQKAGIPQDDRLIQGIGDFVNTATGRGSLGSWEPAANVASQLFFSPRLIASRLNLLNPAYYATLPAGVRKEALRALAGFTGLMGTTIGLAKAAGADVSVNWTSPDFIKIKVGNTRYDFGAGFQQYLRLGAQIAKNETTSSTTGKTTELGSGYGVPTRLDMVKRFVVGKFAPVPSFAAGLLEGRTFTGEKFSVPREIAQRVIPLMVQDLRDLIQEEGWVGVPKSIPGFLGVGVQTYQPRRKR